jgi:hypothetical protein
MNTPPSLRELLERERDKAAAHNTKDMMNCTADQQQEKVDFQLQFCAGWIACQEYLLPVVEASEPVANCDAEYQAAKQKGEWKDFYSYWQRENHARKEAHREALASLRARLEKREG